MMDNVHGPLARLLEGNRRFLSGEASAGRARWEPDLIVVAQRPFAAVLGCSDSRVPPERIFDLGPGELFVVRVAGNVAGPSETGSLEYAVGHLGVPLLLVLGHEDCGAVKASFGAGAGGAVQAIIDRIRPAVEGLAPEGGPGREERLMEAIQANVSHTMDRIVEGSAVIAEALGKGDLVLAGAVFALSTGKVSILEKRPG